MEAKAVDIKKEEAVNEFGSVETIINLPQTSFVPHDIKWIEFRTQIASAHAQRVWIKFDQIAHALFGFNLGRRRKNVELVIFKEGSGQCCLALHVGGRCCVLYKRQCYNTLWQWVPVSESLGVILSDIIGWTCPIVADYYKFIFFVEAGFLIWS